MKRKLIIVCSVSVILLVGFLYIPHFVYKFRIYSIKVKVESHIKSLVGEEYFRQNFKLLSTSDTSGYAVGPFPPHTSFKYEFIPFSGIHKYYITISNYGSEVGPGPYSKGIPPCALDKNENRCDFDFIYSQAYEAAGKKLNNLSTHSVDVFLVKVNDIYKWNAQILTAGSVDCRAEWTRFYIDPMTGQESEAEFIKEIGCI